MSNDGGFENYILEKLNNAKGLNWGGKSYDEAKAVKPVVKSMDGECKTDAYISLRNNGEEIDCIKITIKKNTAHFWANKLTATTAKNLLGENWSNILRDSIEPIRDKLLARKILAAKPKKTPTDIYLTLGWKLEIAKVKRTLSSPLALDKAKIVEKILMGTDQTESQKNPYIYDAAVVNAGVANYLLEGEEGMFESAQSVLDSLIDLSKYTPPEAYLIFTANNYRIMANKADGPRTLAVAVSWDLVDGKIEPRFIFDQPLQYKGETDMMPIVKNSLETIGIPKTTYQSDSVNIEDLFDKIKNSLVLSQ